MTSNVASTFVRRLKGIGIDVELAGNYPWVYLYKVNGNKVEGKYWSEHYFTAFFQHPTIKFTDRRVVFKKVREYL